MEARVFLAEDDANLGLILKESLEAKGCEVELFRDGQAAWEGYDKGSFDICLLDIMMPLKDGFTLAREIRKVDEEIPIIFLTAKSMKEDKIEGFKSGADDYINKPFSMEELTLRMEAILRRTKRNSPDMNRKVFELGAFSFDSEKRLLNGPDGEKRLTTKEADLLKMLCIHHNQLLERDIALKAVWGDDNYFTGRSMDVYITKLRKYLKSDPNIEIQNIHGTGFKLVSP
jgi:DNA-binding response OmpR family regulator